MGDGEVKAKDTSKPQPQRKLGDERNSKNETEKGMGMGMKRLPHQQLPQPSELNTEALEKL